MPENRRLVRMRESRVLAGVCTGLGRYTRVDPVVFRVGFAVLALAGHGTGIFLYVAAALLMPGDADANAVVERLFKRRLDGDAVLALLGALLTVSVLFSIVGGGLSTGPLTVLTVFALALLVAHARGVNLVQVARTLPEHIQGRPQRHPRDRPPTVTTQPMTATMTTEMVDLATLGTATTGTGTGTFATTRPLPPSAASQPADTVAPPQAPAEKSRGRSVLTRLTLLATLGAGAAAAHFTAHQPVEARTQVPIAVALTVLGLGLVVASWYGRSRGLVSLGVVLSLALVAASTAGELPRNGRWGDVHWRPVSTQAEQSYKVVMGEGNLDLTALPLSEGQRVQIQAEVLLGGMNITVPRTATTQVSAWCSLGDVSVAGKVTSGQPGAKVNVVLPAEDDGRVTKDAPVIELHVRGRVGDVEVRRA